MTKICSKCKMEYDMTNFYHNKKDKSGYDPWCKSCCKENVLKYYNNNKEKSSIKHKEYYRLNATYRKKQVYSYKRKRMKCDSIYKIRQNISIIINHVLKNRGYTKTSKTFDILGCTYEELLIHLGPKPDGEIHLDHICPCSQAQNEEELIKLQHYSNLRWLPASTNLTKSDNHTCEAEQKCKELLGRGWLE